MNAPLFRLNLSQLMLAVAGLGLMFAMLGVVGGSIASTFLALMIWPIGLPSSTERIEGWAWSVALYPTLVLVAIASTWITARLALGHDPNPLEFRRSYPTPLIVGARIATSFLSFLVPVSFVACAFLSVAAAKRRSLTETELTGTRNALTSARWPATWLAGFAILTWDPFGLAAAVLK